VEDFYFSSLELFSCGIVQDFKVRIRRVHKVLRYSRIWLVESDSSSAVETVSGFRNICCIYIHLITCKMQIVHTDKRLNTVD
jgi:hypothetical protein